MLRKSFLGWRIKQEIQKLTVIRTPSPRLNPVRDSPTRPTPLTSLPPLPLLFSYCQKNLPPTSQFRFTRQTTRFPLSTGSVATRFSATAYYSCAPEPDSFTHVEDPNPNVDSLRESSVGVNDGREDHGEGLGHGRTLPEELSSTVVSLTCVSMDRTCNEFVICQGLSGEQVPIVCCLKPEEPHLHLWEVDVDMYESLMLNLKVSDKKAVVNKVVVRRGHEHREAYEEAKKYGGELEEDPGSEFHVAKDDCAPRDLPLIMSCRLSTQSFISAMYALEEDVYDMDKDDENDEDKDDEYDLGEGDWFSQFQILDKKEEGISP